MSDSSDDDKTPTLARQSTMQATADAGVEFLKAQKADSLIKAQGLEHLTHKNGTPSNDEQNGDAPKPTKQSTMAATITEGEMLQNWMGGAVDADAKTRAQQKHIDEVIELDDEADETPAMTKTHTMMATTEEGAQLVGDSVDPDVKTRAQQRHIEDAMADVPKIAKTHTITETLKDADALLDALGGRVDDDVKTRAQQHKKRAADADDDDDDTSAKKPRQ